MLHPKWVKKPFPDPVRSIAHIVWLSDQSYTWIGVDRQGFGQVRPIVGAGSYVRTSQPGHFELRTFQSFTFTVLLEL